MTEKNSKNLESITSESFQFLALGCMLTPFLITLVLASSISNFYIKKRAKISDFLHPLPDGAKRHFDNRDFTSVVERENKKYVIIEQGDTKEILGEFVGKGRLYRFIRFTPDSDSLNLTEGFGYRVGYYDYFPLEQNKESLKCQIK